MIYMSRWGWCSGKDVGRNSTAHPCRARQRTCRWAILFPALKEKETSKVSCDAKFGEFFEYLMIKIFYNSNVFTLEGNFINSRLAKSFLNVSFSCTSPSGKIKGQKHKIPNWEISQNFSCFPDSYCLFRMRRILQNCRIFKNGNIYQWSLRFPKIFPSAKKLHDTSVYYNRRLPLNQATMAFHHLSFHFTGRQAFLRRSLF